jgi:hypothetical protein
MLFYRKSKRLFKGKFVSKNTKNEITKNYFYGFFIFL